MLELVLHHYALPPFFETVRAKLGYTGLFWCWGITSRYLWTRWVQVHFPAEYFQVSACEG